MSQRDCSPACMLSRQVPIWTATVAMVAIQSGIVAGKKKEKPKIVEVMVGVIEEA